jgi:hypothetical protein
MRASREEWRSRVERWQASGLTAGEFAGKLAINAGTLKFWKYLLGREARGQSGRTGRAPGKASDRRPRRGDTLQLVELRPAIAMTDGRFEVDLARGRRLRIPASFEAEALRRLLAVLEAS